MSDFPMLKKIRQRLSFGKDSWDPVAYWSTRASDPDSMSVMWANRAYNDLVDRDEWDVIERHLPARRDTALDLGCGTGRVSERLASRFGAYTGVDMPAMVEEAARRHPDLADRYVAATVETYAFPEEVFDFVLSLGCVATACSRERLEDMAPRMVRSVRHGGRLLFIEPFHTSRLLTRGCRMRTHDVTELFERCGMTVDHVDGMLFPPGRFVLSEGVMQRVPRLTQAAYRAGEAVLRLNPVALADYKIIALSRI
jgi:SAM-dependent methyltransferase